ncbi:MAG: glycosyltransferase family 4 protein [Candidatus Alcyoniella australis]|nr:glycosyltransferase family 4 protein [Candidatus Alcyoniella australis]
MSQATCLYSIAAHLNGGGIGRIAKYAALGLFRAGLLGELACQGVQRGILPDELVQRRPFRLPRRLVRPLSDQSYYYLKNLDFDRWQRRMVDNDHPLYHGWTAQAPRSLELAQRAGKRTILTRGSTHILSQARLIAEAGLEVGVKREPIMPAVVARCLDEYRIADLIVVPSEFVKRSFEENGHSRDNLIVVPFGVDPLVDWPHPEFNVRPSGPYRLLFVGQVSLRKGVVPLLKAIKILHQRGSDLILNMAGVVDAQARQIIDRLDFPRDKVVFLDFVPHPAGYMSVADAFVFPTYEEGSALVTYEAMAAGAPMITTANAGSIARHEQEALLVPPGDAQAIADAVQRLMDDPQLATQLGQAARARVAPYSWDLYGARIALVHRLAAQGLDRAEIQRQIDDMV